MPNHCSCCCRHFRCIDTTKALEELPDCGAIPATVAHVQRYLDAVLRDHASRRRSNQVVKNLLTLENMQVREELIRAQAEAYKVAPQRLANRCEMPIGDQVFACYPTQAVIRFVPSAERPDEGDRESLVV